MTASTSQPPAPALTEDTVVGCPATLVLNDTPVDWTDPAGTETEDPVAWADRRLSDRFPAGPCARAEVRRWGTGAGPDFAEELVDVSEGGLRVVLNLAARPGERFDITLWGPDGEWRGRAMGVIRWIIRKGPATVLAGLQLTRPLPPRIVRNLAGQPVNCQATQLANPTRDGSPVELDQAGPTGEKAAPAGDWD